MPYQNVHDDWKKLLGKNCVMVEDIAKIPEVIKDGKIVKIRKGDFTAEVDAEPNE